MNIFKFNDKTNPVYTLEYWNIWNLEYYNNKILFYLIYDKKYKWRSRKKVPSQYQDFSAW